MTHVRSVTAGSRARNEERTLIEAAQRDRARFSEIYDEYFGVVYGYVSRRVTGRGEAEDVTSEVFQKALQHLPRFRWTGAPFAAWLIRIASNRLIDRAKLAARETEIDTEELALRVAPLQEKNLEQAERSAQLFRLVKQLPEDQRRVIELRFAEGKSIYEIAQDLERTAGAIKQLQFRAVENLKKMFERMNLNR